MGMYIQTVRFELSPEATEDEKEEVENVIDEYVEEYKRDDLAFSTNWYSPFEVKVLDRIHDTDPIEYVFSEFPEVVEGAGSVSVDDYMGISGYWENQDGEPVNTFEFREGGKAEGATAEWKLEQETGMRIDRSYP